MSHGLGCPVACGILVTWPGIEPGSPALEGRFSINGPPGKSQHHIFFIHSSVHGHVGCFHILVIMNCAAMNIRAHLSPWIIIFYGYMPRSGIAGAYCNSTITFLKNLHTVLHSGCTSLCSTNSNKRFWREEYISNNIVIMAYMWWLLKANWPCFQSFIACTLATALTGVSLPLLRDTTFNHNSKKSPECDSERVTGRKVRGLETEEIGCKHQTFFISPLIGRRKQTTGVRFFFSFSIQN